MTTKRNWSELTVTLRNGTYTFAQYCEKVNCGTDVESLYPLGTKESRVKHLAETFGISIEEATEGYDELGWGDAGGPANSRT
jgi:hypothetical protein